VDEDRIRDAVRAQSTATAHPYVDSPRIAAPKRCAAFFRIKTVNGRVKSLRACCAIIVARKTQL